MKKKLWLVGALMCTMIVNVMAKEGMWIPLLLQQYNASDLENMGLKISVSDIYDANKSSMKDAVVLFGGGCTAEIISDQGLLLTNHHCGYGRIQSHSSVEHDYLKDGFWAMNQKEELPNEGLSVTFIKEIKDVSKIVLEGIDIKTDESKRQELIASRIDSLKKTVKEEDGYGSQIKPFYHGNQYFMFITETFEDVRLVGAPPSSIGKFGFDTDNWVWPRHTGDFSVFRIYAGKDNKPAKYAEDNVPYRPRHHFPVSLAGVAEDDFSMVFGFPARTNEYLPSTAVKYIINEENPSKIRMRDISLGIINKAMRSSAELNIKYAAKQSRISNAWKKYKGQILGLNKTHAIEKKQEIERSFNEKVNNNAKFSKYKGVLEAYEVQYKDFTAYSMARSMFIEIYYYGPEILRFSKKFSRLAKPLTEEERKAEIEKLKAAAEKFYKDYDPLVDEELMKNMIPEYLVSVTTSLVPPTVFNMFGYNDPKKAGKTSKSVFDKSIFASKERLFTFLDKYNSKSYKKVASDPAYIIATDIENTYRNVVSPHFKSGQMELDSIQRVYMAGLMEVLPDYKNYYPDANFSLRLSYGKVKGSEPVDGMEYKYYTTMKGIAQKRDTASYEFNVPQKLMDLYESKDFGQYADSTGQMHVCYTATNHTSGGNSGSPALNAKGELVGLNFDRTWESTMSDIMYDPNICRNIMVDIRYVLFIIDKYAGATHLVEEMDLIK
ncbi:S46 family peptidase [bacterium SCSIO 12643]|nr:S46 family peptidase [bacterium SCSIO 12643]